MQQNNCTIPLSLSVCNNDLSVCASLLIAHCFSCPWCFSCVLVSWPSRYPRFWFGKMYFVRIFIHFEVTATDVFAFNLIRFLFWCCWPCIYRTNAKCAHSSIARDGQIKSAYARPALLHFVYFIYDLNPMKKIYGKTAHTFYLHKITNAWPLNERSTSVHRRQSQNTQCYPRAQICKLSKNVYRCIRRMCTKLQLLAAATKCHLHFQSVFQAVEMFFLESLAPLNIRFHRNTNQMLTPSKSNRNASNMSCMCVSVFVVIAFFYLSLIKWKHAKCHSHSSIVAMHCGVNQVFALKTSIVKVQFTHSA